MTIIEMHDNLDILLDNSNEEWFTPKEKDVFINDAQLEFGKTLFEEFERTERVTEALLPLVRYHTGTGNTINLEATPETFMYVLGLRSSFPDTGCGVETDIPVRKIQQGDEDVLQDDPFNSFEDYDPGFTQRHDGTGRIAEILAPSVSTAWRLKYFMLPTDVLNDEAIPSNNIDSVFPEQTHPEILRIACRMALATLESPSYAVQINENQLTN